VGDAAVGLCRLVDGAGHQRGAAFRHYRVYHRAHGGARFGAGRAHRWLGQASALGELLDVDYEAMPLMSLYRASDALWKRHTAIKSALFSRACDLFALDTTVTLYDLTNTYCEGEVPNNGKAHHERSKEKRSDCPLMTLGVVVDGSGFVRRSQTFAGNVTAAGTLETMLTGLNAPPGALVVMDAASIATETSIDWLRSNGYRYLAVSRERARQFDSGQAVAIKTASGDTVQCQTSRSEDGREVRLYCHSPARERKDEAIAEGLSHPRTENRIDKLWARIGRRKEKHHGIGQHYRIELPSDDSGKNAIGLTDLEAVIRSLKSELGLRPVFHHKEQRADGHLFITVLAYQFVQSIRRRLKEGGIDASWNSIRQTLAGQCRVTASFRRTGGRALHVRKATRAEPGQLAIYRALNLDPAPGGVRKTIV
jgi:hypothetical protein